MKRMQENYWAENPLYISRSNSFNTELGVKAWSEILSQVNVDDLKSVLELGANIGRNIITLESMLTKTKFAALDINKEALSLLKQTSDAEVIHSSILDMP